MGGTSLRPGTLRGGGLAVVLLAAVLAGAPAASIASGEAPASPLEFTLERIDGTPEPLAGYRGRVLLLVNVASRCGLTPQYEGLEALYDRYRERGFAVLGFPANDFAGQEPGSNEEIAEFCRSTYGVRFPMFAKLSVTGEAQHPLYRMLTGLPAPLGGPVEWNFQKYLVDREGRVVARFAPRVPPEDPALVAQIERLLDSKAD
jgi:glutathione peroxidase